MAVNTGIGKTRSGVFSVIIGLVAGRTIVLIGRIEPKGEPGQNMAASTSQWCMRPDEIETVRDGDMVEGCALPGKRRVALLAILRES